MIHDSPSRLRLVRAAQHAALVLALALVGCGQKCDTAPGAAGGKGGAPGGGPPPAEVGVVTVQLRPVSLVVELPGRLEASPVPPDRPRAAGHVQKRRVVESSHDRARPPLLHKDP
jgi:membrane fusion protein (multidrug efflux system)